ncbi:MAG: Mrp/NBP35 family ATP-binding protein [Thermoplasmata archaeon YP2-bin.285]|uniref:Iron-sulfur cluster carrier protein n=1 Tax=Candidatus Sysuiplasma superficiale TaxID=2823368 RepID=A0A8J8CDB0_9ARCH|nr:Mrp/NBP35 family ATP-binding protein [Candidatus Sysuiplasma superficiale]
MTDSDPAEAISRVPHPEENATLASMGWIWNVDVKERKVKVTVSVPGKYPFTSVIENDITAVLEEKGYSAEVEFAQAAEKEEPGKVKRKVELPVVGQGGGTHTGIDALPRQGIRNIIAVASGKGGVGKSFMTAVLGTHLSMLGYRTAIIDADITGPCISRMFGLSALPGMGEDGKIEPLVSQGGLRIMSIDVIMDRFRTPLIWRGPLINSAIRGLFSETRWGDIHYLLVDLPPGTSDAPLTVFQSMKPDGVVFVTSPMEIARSVVSRAVSMAKEMHVPVIGFVENMSHLVLPGNKTINIFGRESSERAAAEFGIPFLGSIPIDTAVSALSDRGEIELYRNSELFTIIRRMRFRLAELHSARKESV